MIPNPGARIPANGVEPTIVLGASVDAQLGLVKATTSTGITKAQQAADAAAQTARLADQSSQARDQVLAAEIAAMEGMTYVGPWDPSRTYRINDVVTHGGDSWARLTAGSEGEPGDLKHWGLVAQRGAGGGFGDLSETSNSGLWETVDHGIEDRLETLDKIKRTNVSAGEGAPTGTAPVGWIHLDLATDDIYRMDPSGWTRRTRDTGFRDITGQISAQVTSGRLLVRRRGGELIVLFDDLVFAASASNTSLPRLTGGFRPRFRGRGIWFPSTAYTLGGSFGITDLGYFNIYNVNAGEAVSARLALDAAGAFPTSFPGTEVP